MSAGVWRRSRVLAAWALAFGPTAWAAGSGLNVAVVVNQRSSNSVELGNYYCERRQVPPQNLLRIDWSGGNVSWSTSQVQSVLIAPLTAMLSDRGLTPQIDVVLLSMDIPYRVTGGVDNNSTTSVLFYGFKTNNPSDPGPCRIGPASYSAYAGSETAFRSGSPGNTAGAFLTAMLTGNTLDDAKYTVDRGGASDATLPSQTVWLEKTTDTARNVRHFAFDDAIFNLRLDGSFPLVRTNSNTTLGFTDLLGMQTGLARFDLGTGVFIPGAMGDSLTSYGGRLFEATGQTNLLAFLRAGAAASYGTVIEPCNYTEKFPDPMVYFYAARGFSLVECYYQSLVSPYQGLIVGEPLAAPFGRPGQGAWVGLPAGTVLSGTAELEFAASAHDAQRPLQQVDLFVDGTLHSTVTNCPPAAGNQLSVTLNGPTIHYTVPEGATLASVTSGLAEALNAQQSDTEVQAIAQGDRIELRSTNPGIPGAGFTLAAAQAAGGAEALTTFLRASRSDFLDSTARGCRSFQVSGTAVEGDYVGVSITKTDGSKVELEVTNGASPVDTVTLTRRLLNLINTTTALKGADGVSAEDNYAEGTTELLFFLFARTAGWPAAQVQVQLRASPNLSVTPDAAAHLDENLADLQPRNHLYLAAGAAAFNLVFPLDTLALPDGYHELTLLAYEGSHVRTPTRWSQTVRVQNTSLSALFASSVTGGSAAIDTTLQFTVVANRGDIARLELFGTGGLLASAAGQSQATFSIAATSLGLGLHPFEALVTASDGTRYRTDTKTIRIVVSVTPTASSLLGFEAQRTAPDHVLVTWRTGVEARLLGFHLERQQPDGAWSRVTAGLVPAVGGGEPNSYQWEDTDAPVARLAYRLVGIDWTGRPTVLAQTAVRAGLWTTVTQAGGDLTVSAQGEAGHRVFLETTTDAAHGPWRPCAAFHLDSNGSGLYRLPLPSDAPVGFYRWRQK